MNPHGIHHPEHFTTAYDICLITKKALQIPKFREIVSKVSYLKPKTNKQPQAEIRQWNGLIRAGKHHYPKSIGVKTGFHSHAKNTLVGAAVHEGRTLIAVLLGCPTKGSRYQDAVRLFETAFAEKKQERCYLAMDQLFRREIEGAKTPLIARMKEDLSLSFFPSEEPTCKAFIHWGDCALPIQAGASVGEVRLLDEKGAIVKRVDLVATQEVKGTFFFNLKRKLF